MSDLEKPGICSNNSGGHIVIATVQVTGNNL